MSKRKATVNPQGKMLIDRIGEWLLITFTPFFLVGNAIRIIFKEVVKTPLDKQK